MKARSRFRPGTTALLRQAIGDLPRGTVVKVVDVIAGSERPTYLVQPFVSAVREQEHAEPEPIGPVLTVDGTFLARSLPDLRSGINIILP